MELHVGVFAQKEYLINNTQLTKGSPPHLDLIVEH